MMFEIFYFYLHVHVCYYVYCIDTVSQLLLLNNVELIFRAMDNIKVAIRVRPMIVR